MDRDEDISIIVPAYNHARTVGQTLDSILDQEMPFTSRIYCLDDASTDSTGAILTEYSERYPSRIKVYTNPRNMGSGRASHYYNRLDLPGRYWCFLEGDDFWTSREKLRRQLSFLEANPEFVGCSCNTVMLDEVTGERRVIAPTWDEWNFSDMFVLRGHSLYVHTSSVVWRHIYKSTGFYFPPEYAKPCYFGDNMLLHMMLLLSGGKMKNIPIAMSCYRSTGSGVWSSLSENEKRLQNRYIRKTLRRKAPFKYRLYRKFPWLKNIRLISKYLPQRPING